VLRIVPECIFVLLNVFVILYITKINITVLIVHMLILQIVAHTLCFLVNTSAEESFSDVVCEVAGLRNNKDI